MEEPAGTTSPPGASARRRPRRAPRVARWVLGALLVTLWVPPAPALERDAALAEIRRTLLRQLRGEDVAGAAIALVAGGEVVWQEAFGYAAREERRPLEVSTPVLAGDLTKLVTALLALRLAQEGRLELDVPVTRYLPELAIDRPDPHWPAPTTRQLLTHLGGLVTNVHAGSFRAEPPPRRALLPPLEQVQAPGRIYSYSHLGFQLAGAVVEAVSGRDYADAARTLVLEPLGLRDSGFGPRPKLARPHDRRERQQAMAWPRDTAALGLVASIRDLGRLMVWLLAEETAPVLERRWVDELGEVQNRGVALDLDNRTAIAFQMTNTGRHAVERVQRMNSVTIQHRGIMLLAPDHGVAVTLIANSSAAGELVREVGELALDLLLEAEAGIERPEREDALPERLGLPAGARPAPLAERYSTPLGELRVTGADPTWNVEFVGRPFRLDRREDGWYRVAYRLLKVIDLRFSFLAEILLRPVRLDGEGLLLARYRGSSLLLGTAVPPAQRDPGAQRWTGRYRLVNGGLLAESLEIEEVEVLAEAGRLYLSYRVPAAISIVPRVPLERLGPGRYRVPGLGLNTGQQVRFRDGPEGRSVEMYGWRLLATP